MKFKVQINDAVCPCHSLQVENLGTFVRGKVEELETEDEALAASLARDGFGVSKVTKKKATKKESDG